MRRPCAGGYSATVMHADPACPPGAVCIVDPFAAVVIDESLKLRASHPAAPPLDVLDLVLRGRRGRPINFGDVAPVSPLGVLVVEAFDRGMPVSDWIGFYRFPPPCDRGAGWRLA